MSDSGANLSKSKQLVATVEARQDDIRRELLDTYFAEHSREFLDSEAGGEALFEHAFRRTRFCAHTIVPWIEMFCDLENSTVVEIGGGTGSSTVVVAAEAKKVVTYDIAEVSVEAARRRAKILGLDNIEFHCIEPARITDQIRADNEGTADVVLLFATLEHQKLDERIASLRAAWDCLADGGILVVGDTPNRLAYEQQHTARMPFYDMLPDGVGVHFADQSPNRAFANAVKRQMEVSFESTQELIDRWGRGVSFHEFEMALGDLRPITVGHGFEEKLLRAGGLQLEDKILIKYFREAKLDVPLGFARQTLYVILQKSDRTTAPEPRWWKKFDPDNVFGFTDWNPQAVRWRRKRSWKKIITFSGALGVALAVFTLLAFETTMRIATGHLLGVASQLRGLYTLEDGKVVATPGWVGEHTVDGETVAVRMNGLGMRGAEIATARTDGELRVLALGDAFAWGYGVGDTESYPARLEQHLRTAAHDRAVVVGNAALPSHGTKSQVAVLERVHAEFSPDAVVAAVSVTDDFLDDARVFETVVDGYRFEDDLGRVAESSWRCWLAAHCFTAQWIEHRLVEWSPGIAITAAVPSTSERLEALAKLPPPNLRTAGLCFDVEQQPAAVTGILETFQASFRRMREVVGDSVPILCVVIPASITVDASDYATTALRHQLDPTQLERGLGTRRIAAALEAVGVSCIDLSPRLMSDREPSANWQPTGKHFSARGHDLVAGWIAERLAPLLGLDK